VLAAVYLDDELLFTAAEIGEVGTDGKLPGEVIAAQPARPQLLPKEPFSIVFDPP